MRAALAACLAGAMLAVPGGASASPSAATLSRGPAGAAAGAPALSRAPSRPSTGATGEPSAAAPGATSSGLVREGSGRRSQHQPTRRDLDGDGIINSRDRDVDGDRIANRLDRDVDGDGVPNALDTNVDGDARRNSRDLDVDGDFRMNVADSDVDGDGLPNDYDHDIDGDRVENAWDYDSDSSGDAQLGASGVAPLEPGFLGVVSDDAFWGTDADPSRAKTMAAITATGARVLRQSFSWSIIEPSPGHYDFDLHDDFVATAARNGISVLPILFDPPPFRSSSPASGARGGVYPPASNADFAAFAALLVRRYGPDGAFWRAHPELPQLPIRSWQIWNEPNIPQYWASGPKPAAYAELLKATAPAIKAVDPGAKVVTAGLNESELGIKLVPFLRGMYAAGAKDSFDVLGIHPYAPASDLVVDQVTRAVREIARNGDDARTLITELGWATGGPSKRALVVDESAQAALIKSTIARLARLRGRLRLDGVFYFNWRDSSPEAGASDRWGLHTGLLREDGSPKPALQALAQAAQGSAS